MKYLIVGFFSCVSHQNHNFIKPDNIDPKYRVDGVANHFSYYKDIYIGEGLAQLGNDVHFLFGELLHTVKYNRMTYMCNKDIDEKFVRSMDAILFFKHNKGIIDDILDKNEGLKKLFIEKTTINKNKLYKPYIACKTCVLPSVGLLRQKLKKGLGETFDFFFLQTSNVSLDNSIIKELLGIKQLYNYKKQYDDYLKIKRINEYHENNRIHASEMFVAPSLKFSKICPFERKAKYVLCYIGRLRQNYGMTVPF